MNQLLVILTAREEKLALWKWNLKNVLKNWFMHQLDKKFLIIFFKTSDVFFSFISIPVNMSFSHLLF